VNTGQLDIKLCLNMNPATQAALLADLVLGRETDLTRLPWVGHSSPEWEPEPLRWLGVNLGRALAGSIDRADAAGRDPKLRKKMFGRLLA
jgi:hypothetical protein